MQSPTEINLRRVLVGHRAAVNVVDFDEKYIVSASGDRTIKVCQLLCLFCLHVVIFLLSVSITHIVTLCVQQKNH